MIFVLGKRPYGKVDACEGSFVYTAFWHLCFVPLIPTESFAVSVRPSDKHSELLSVPLSGRSVLAAYLRTPSVMTFAVAVIDGLATEAVLVPFVVASLALAVFLFAMLKVGRLTRDERAERMLYQEQLGVALDAALLSTPENIARVNDAVLARLPAACPDSYRGDLLHARDWKRLAADEAVTDHAFLSAAFTLARLSLRGARGAERNELAELHAKIGRRLLAHSAGAAATP